MTNAPSMEDVDALIEFCDNEHGCRVTLGYEKHYIATADRARATARAMKASIAELDSASPYDLTGAPGLQQFIRKQIATAVEAERAKSEKRIKELEAALVPFAEACRDNIDCDADKWRDGESIWESPAAMALTVGDLRAARSAIKAEGE